MKRYVVLIGMVLFSTSMQTFSEEASVKAFLAVFLDESPLQGVAVSLDGTVIGKTDERGGASALLRPGKHVFTLAYDGVVLPVAFSADTDEEVEVKATFTALSIGQAQYSVRKYGLGDTSGAGFIAGQILDQVGTPMAGVSVSAVGTSYRTITDGLGIYQLDVPRGLYQLKVRSTGYEDATIGDLRVLADLGVTAKIILRNDDSIALTSQEIEEVYVLGVFKPQKNSTSIERFATSITTAIDVAQLERFGDADVAAALNRVVGVAVTGNKYATVRGLDGRYISSTLNGLLMPSTDPQRRDVQLDLFPTDILEGIEIQKSYTPDQLATTTGGSIKIISKSLPDERIRKLSGSLGVNANFTGDDIITYRNSNDDWVGFDSGLRNLPDGVLAATHGGRSLNICDPRIDPLLCTSPLDAARLGVLFQDDYNVEAGDAWPDGSVSGVLADRLSAGDNEWGYYLAASYDRSTGDRGEAELTNPLETTGSYMRSRITTDLNGYFALGYEYGHAGEILSKTTVLRSSDNTTRVESGIDGGEDNQIDRTILEWVERQFISQSFSGHDELEFEQGTHTFDWRAAYSRTTRDEPDRRQYTYFNGNLSTSAFERRWSELDEHSIDLGLDYGLRWDWADVSSTDFKVGLLWSDKDREVDQYRFGIRAGDRRDILFGIDQDLERDILPYANFALDRIRLAANTADTDSYDSQEETKAFFLSANTELGELWSVLVGARYEEFEQSLAYPNDEAATNALSSDDWYPAVNIAFRPVEQWQLRLGYSQTVSYPGLVERSEAQSFDPDTDDPIFGNPDLQVSSIDNLDLRAEYYFADGDSVSVALFAKKIDSPVERAIPDASGSAARGTTFVNQDKADLFGIEIDANKILLERDEYVLSFGGNIAYIDSKVELSEDSIRLEGEAANGRALQGQSEWLANVQFSLDHYLTEQKFTLLLNYFDDRIFRISRGATTGPELEVERLVVDLVYEKIFRDSFTLDASIKNLFNEDVEFAQSGRTIESFETGTSISVGANYRF